MNMDGKTHRIAIGMREDVSIKVLLNMADDYDLEKIEVTTWSKDYSSLDFIITVTVEELIAFVQDYEWATTSMQDLDQNDGEEFVYMAQSY